MAAGRLPDTSHLPRITLVDGKMTPLCDLTIQGGLLFLIIFTPLAFGTVYPWGIAVMECVVLGMALAWVLKLLRTGGVRLVRTPLNLPILLFLGLIGLQLLPLPPTVLYFVSPSTYSLYQQTLAGWPDHELLPLVPQEAASGQAATSRKDADSPGLSSGASKGGEGPADRGHDFRTAYASQWRPLSLYPHATWAAFSLALTYAAVFLITVNNVRSWHQLSRLLLTLLSVGGVVAVLGLLQKVSGTEKIYWFWKPTWGGSPFGPYVNRNHFAGYMAMVLPVGLGWLWSQVAQSQGRDHGAAGWGWRERLAAGLGDWNGRLLLLAFALVNMATALIFSASRGGIMSFVSSLLFFTLLVGWSRRGERRLALVGLVLTACVFAYALWLGIDHVWQRFMEIDLEREGRITYWSATLRLISEFPLLGTGLGTYIYSFQRYNTVLEQVVVDSAHNDYLELLAEAGFVGFLLVVGGLGWFCWRTLKHWFTRHDPKVLGSVLGGLTSVFAIGIHSLVDFNLHIPANALLLSVILGLTSVAVHLRQQQGQSVVIFQFRERRLPRLLRLAMPPLALALTLALALCIGQSLAAERQAALAERMERAARGIEALEAVAEQWA
jgi:O-antigen ligase